MVPIPARRSIALRSEAAAAQTSSLFTSTSVTSNPLRRLSKPAHKSPTHSVTVTKADFPRYEVNGFLHVMAGNDEFTTFLY